MNRDLATLARSVLDTNIYLTLGTADRDGRPWATPVYFAAADDVDFYWTSDADARHSRNIADRPQVSLVVFDSQVPPYTGRAVYLSGEAIELSGTDLERGLDIYPGPRARGGAGLTLGDVTAPSPWRLYRARVTEHSISCPRDRGRPCALHGRTTDHRASYSPAGR